MFVKCAARLGLAFVFVAGVLWGGVGDLAPASAEPIQAPGRSGQPAALTLPADRLGLSAHLALTDTLTVRYYLPVVATFTQVGQFADAYQGLGYLLYVPPTYGQDPAKRWPVVLFLHGVGERGSDPNALVAQGLPKLVSQGSNFDFIMVSPQCQAGQYWSDIYTPIMNLLTYIQTTYAVDVQRTYLTGLSMGGYGAIGLGQAYPSRFAALAPIAGGYFWDPNIPAAGHYTGDLNAPIPPAVCALKNTPAWFFHGLADTVIPPSQSQNVVNALKACPSVPVPKLTLYAGAGHIQSWELAYAEPTFYTWLLSQSR